MYDERTYVSMPKPLCLPTHLLPTTTTRRLKTQEPPASDEGSQFQKEATPDDLGFRICICICIALLCKGPSPHLAFRNMLESEAAMTGLRLSPVSEAWRRPLGHWKSYDVPA
jgi:hypothetical protein